MVFSIPSEIRWVVQQVRPLFWLHLASLLCVTAGSLLVLVNPLILKWLIDQVLPRRQPRAVLAAVVLLFLTYAGRMALISLGGWVTLHATQKLALNLRTRVLRRLDTLSADYHENTPIGCSIYPLNEPIDEIASFGSELVPSLLRTLVTMMVTLGAMLILNARATLVVLPLILVFLLVRGHFRSHIQNAADSVQHGRRCWSSFLQEHIAAAISLQLLRRELRQERRAFLFLARIARAQQRLYRTGVLFTVSTGLTVALALSAVIGYGGWCVVSGSLTVGGLVALYTYLLQMFEPLSGAVEVYAHIQKTLGSIRQVQAVLALRPTILSSHECVEFPESGRWDILATAVHFSYASEARLCIPSLHIPPGELLAIAGANGAGKSTLGKLLVRLYDADAGWISIGGTDIRNIRLDSLRRHACYLPQHPAVFDGTLAMNLRLAKPSASPAELEQVVDQVGLSAWLHRLPQGWDHAVGPGGSHLSAGERQRLGIARALLQRPSILVLDEAASCLDALSEQLLLRNFRHLLPGATLIVISHRLSTIACASRALLLDGGRIVGDGSPSELLKDNGLYRRLFHAAPRDSGRCASR